MQFLARSLPTAAFVLFMACSGGGGTTPTSPSATPTPAPPTLTFALRGTVRAVPTADASSAAPVGVPNVTVRVVEGVNAGTTAETGVDGSYTIGGLLAGSLTLSATKAGYQQRNTTVTLSGSMTQDIDIRQTCDPWPPEASEILSKLTMPSDLCFVRVVTPARYSFYSAVARTVFVRAEDLADGNVVRHELGHAHQHRVILDAGLPDPRFDDTFIPRWAATPDGQSFLELTGWRFDQSQARPDNPSAGWIERCEPRWCGYPNPVEDSAQVTADYFGPSSRQSQLRDGAPLRFQWATRWVPR